MAANLALSFNVVAPLFLEMLLGFFLRRIHLLDAATAASLNKLSFKCFLPVLIFYNIYTTNLSEISDYSYMITAVASIMAAFLILMLVIPRFEKDKRKCGVLIQAGFRSNFVLFGVPVATLLLGEGHAGAVSILVAAVVPTVNMLAVVDLEYFRGKNVNFLGVLKGIVTNPLILGSAAGILVNLSGIRFPASVMTSVSAVAKIGTPLALIVLGSEFRIDAARNYRKQLSAGLLLRLVLVPAVLLSVTALLGYRGEQFVGLMIAYASPVAVNSYIMAEMMDGDGVLASQLVFYSTGLSILTLFVFIFATKTMGMF